MGVDKASLIWNQRSLLDHMAQLLSTVAEEVRVVGRNDLPDIQPGLGPLGGILTVLEVTSTRRNLVVGVDLPLMTPEFLQLFRARVVSSSMPVVACKIGNEYPLCLGIDRSALPEVRQLVKERKLAIHHFIEDSEAEVISEEELLMAGFDKSIFSNVNTPEDWQRIFDKKQ
jgi:molybdopterin-guanine dinucleotide biosynthesis protein A